MLRATRQRATLTRTDGTGTSSVCHASVPRWSLGRTRIGPWVDLFAAERQGKASNQVFFVDRSEVAQHIPGPPLPSRHITT